MRTARLLVAAVFVFALFALPTSASAAPGSLKILLMEAQCDAGTPPATLRTQLLAQPGVAEVEYFDGALAVPSLGTLMPNDLVVAQGDCDWLDEIATGDVLAQYQDNGGVVVGTQFDFQSGGGTYDLGGRWVSQYSPFNTDGDNSGFGDFTLGTVLVPNSPLLAGVSTLNGYYQNIVTTTPGTTVLANWSSGNAGVAVKGGTVGINAYIGDDYGVPWSGDYARLIVNAANLLSPQSFTVSKLGGGTGTIASSVGGVSCGTVCTSSKLPVGAAVTLTATPADKYSSFAGFTGPCAAPTSPCAFTVAANQAFAGTFVSNKVTIKAKRRSGKKATITVKVLDQGKIQLSGRGIKTVKKTVRKPGTYRLTLRTTRSLKRAKYKIKFTPTGGKSRTYKKSVKL